MSGEAWARQEGLGTMRSREEIAGMIRKIEERLLRCGRCGELKPEAYYEGDVICGNCKNLLDANWETLGAWKALKWALGLIDTRQLEEKLGLHYALDDLLNRLKKKGG